MNQADNAEDSDYTWFPLKHFFPPFILKLMNAHICKLEYADQNFAFLGPRRGSMVLVNTCKF